MIRKEKTEGKGRNINLNFEQICIHKGFQSSGVSSGVHSVFHVEYVGMSSSLLYLLLSEVSISGW